MHGTARNPLPLRAVWVCVYCTRVCALVRWLAWRWWRALEFSCRVSAACSFEAKFVSFHC